MMRTFRLGWFAFIYYLSWLLFGLGGLALNLACLPLLLLRDRERRLCALGGGVPLPIKNALEHFGAEMAGYFAE